MPLWPEVERRIEAGDKLVELREGKHPQAP